MVRQMSKSSRRPYSSVFCLGWWTYTTLKGRYLERCDILQPARFSLYLTCFFLVANLAYCSTMKREAVRFSETAINFPQAIRHDFAKGSHHRGNRKYDKYNDLSDDFAKIKVRSFIINNNSFLVSIYIISKIPDGRFSLQIRFTCLGHRYVRGAYRVFLLGWQGWYFIFLVWTYSKWRVLKK
jgi:hypothetical protein